MSNKKKVRKKNNPLSRMQRQLSDIRMWCWQSDFSEDGIPYLNYEIRLNKLMGYRPMGEHHFDGLLKHPFNWLICARVLCTNGSQEWLETVEHTAYNTKLSNIHDKYREMEKEAINAQQGKQVIDVGWIAKTFYKNPDSIKDWYHAHMDNITPERQMIYRLNKT